jgi:hypothetical protein
MTQNYSFMNNKQRAMNGTPNELWFVETNKAFIYSFYLINLEYFEQLLSC